MAYPVTPNVKPGGWSNSPAVGRSDPTRRKLNFNEPSTPGASRSFATAGAGGSGVPGVQRQQQQQQQQQNPQGEVSLPPILRAARTVNHILQYDLSYPDLDSYCRPGASSDYDFQQNDSAWAPFHNPHVYPIPEQIFEKLNGGQVNTKLGLFAEINHAWASIDSSLFLWDYTHPNPEVIGFEESSYNITAVALVPPKKGVFIDTITHLLVVATGSELLLLGVSAAPTPTGARKVALYQTRMGCHRGGPDVSIIAGSASGRIFFGGDTDTDVYELYYQQEEKWFSSRCGKINHSHPGWSSMVSTLSGPIEYLTNRQQEHLLDMAIDDTRNLLYTLSSTSTIRTYHMEAPEKLTKVIEKEKNHCLRDVAHMMDRSPLLNDRMRIVSLSPITAREASKLHLMALTNTGCRLFLSATSSASYMMGPSTNLAPQSMQVQFVKYPPTDPEQRQLDANDGPDLTSRALETSVFGQRFSPGYFFDFVRKESNPGSDVLFVSAPDTGRIKITAPASTLKYYEQCTWIELGLGPGSRAIAVGPTGPPFAAAKQPLGFGNEIAVQFDQAPSEFVVLTNSGVYTIRRKRLVDIFAAAIRGAVGDEGLEKATRRFLKQYGRVETVSAALAVACGQGSDLQTGTSKAVDQETENRARTAFLNYGGQPTLVEADIAQGTLDNVKLSSRHDALALYLTRVVRMLWKEKVVTLGVEPTGGVSVKSTVPTPRLVTIQENLERLRNFLEAGKGVIQGLAGPSDLQRVTSRQEEIALQGEHQALHALQKLMESISEGISFVLMLFDEKVADIYLRLEDTARSQLKDLTFENLFSQTSGKELAKLLVKAIVNRNIQTGSNVETVADALRRRCGSFCSPDDVVIFKAQEQLQRATEQANNPTVLRNLLSESLRLFERVASSLSEANLRAAVEQYIDLKYYAGAIQLCLVVAREKDRGNKALSWINEGRPANDPREESFEERKRCYNLIHEVITRLDAASSLEPEVVDGRQTLTGTKRKEAYDVVNDSADEVFHFDLYDWYIQQNWTDRILNVDSPHVITFLQRLAATDSSHAELLCRFYTHRSRFFEAAQVQADLAKSDFAIDIKGRITLLSKAKSNASVLTIGISRQDQQLLNHDVTELLEVAHIQDDLLERLRADARIPPERQIEIEQALNGPIQSLSELFNNYADQAGYYDLCLLIYHAADYRNPRIIAETWQSLINNSHFEIEERHRVWEESRAQARRPGRGVDNEAPPQPYEVLSTKIQKIAHRTSFDSFIFSIDMLLPLVCEYAITQGQDASIGADPCWPILLFLQLDIAHALVVRVLERIFEAQETPFTGRRRRLVVQWITVAIESWVREIERNGKSASDLTVIGSGLPELLARCDECLAQIAGSIGGIGGGVRGGGNGHEGELEELRAIRQSVRALKANVEGMIQAAGQGGLFR